ncbi:MAG TPA: phosphotransferase [Polyangiaceae bacterium]|jgi:serine/threonine-protein kinase
MRLPVGYDLVSVVSVGATASVALARTAEGVDCAVKVAHEARGVPAIGREVSALRALESAEVFGVPRVVAFWETGFAMTRIEGVPLEALGERLASDGELRRRVAGAAIARLAEVHGARDGGGPLEMIHGDVSPANLHVGAGEVVLADFGLASWRGAPPAHDGVFRGTLLYAAPEVARGEPFDAAADRFALAASLLNVASGVPLRFATSSPAVILVEAGTHPLDASHPWRTLAPKLFDPELAAWLLGTLAFDPRERPQGPPGAC